MRLKFFFTGFFVFFMALTFVLAHDVQSDEHYHLSGLLESTEELNSHLQMNEVILPSSLGYLVGNGNIAINISMNTGNNEGIYVVIGEKRITSVENGFPGKSNYDVFTDESTVNKVLDSEDISGEILSAYDSNNIRIEANGLGNNIKLFFGKIIFNLFG